MTHLSFRAGASLYKLPLFFKLTLCLTLFSSPVGAWTKFVPLESAQFSKVREKGCVFFHAWASWCQPCLKDLPSLVEWLNQEKRVTPVVVDLSTPFVQDSFSKGYMRSLKPKFPAYLRPLSAEELAYVRTWNEKWRGELPFSELYVNGTRRRTWAAQMDVAGLRREIAALCK